MLPGLSGVAEMVVAEGDLVSGIEGFSLAVLSTPRLIELMESAALQTVKDYLPEDRISVGTRVNVTHLSATPAGMKVTAHALLRSVKDNRLFFTVDAYDEKEKVAEGEHERIVVSRERFIQRVERKRTGKEPERGSE